MVKSRVAKVGDLRQGRIHGVRVGDVDLVLLEVGGEVRALAGRCPHHDAPLADGLLAGDQLVCPWHQAVFDVSDGAVLEPPALECLRSYPVEIDGDDVLVELPDDADPIVQPELVAEDRGADHRSFVIVGGGAAGLAAAQELRRAGFQGRLVMVSDDPDDPYDRTSCSKEYLAGEAPAEWLPLKPPSFYVDAGIERIRHRVDAIDVESRAVTLPGGAVIEADGMLLATGSEPRRLDVPGADLDGVMTLRSRQDSERLAELADASDRVAVIGASFIGMEVAASLRQRGVDSVTVIAPDEVPFEDALGPAVGRVLQSIHEDNGVEFRLGSAVGGFDGDGRVRMVQLEDEDALAAELVVVGVGARPATDRIRGVGLERDGSVRVDERMRVVDGVYAAGDIATFPDWRTGDGIRIEHWRTAQQQGMVAGRNLAGEDRSFRGVPFFWTMQFGVGLGYAGHARSWDQAVVHGDLESRDFMVFYLREGRVLAGAAMGRDRQLNALFQLMARQQEPSTEDLRDGDLDLLRLL